MLLRSSKFLVLLSLSAPPTQYTRLSITDGKVVGSSNISSSQQVYGSIQNSQNNFNATMTRQQQKTMKSQVFYCVLFLHL